MFLVLEITPSGYRFLKRATTSGSKRWIPSIKRNILPHAYQTPYHIATYHTQNTPYLITFTKPHNTPYHITLNKHHIIQHHITFTKQNHPNSTDHNIATCSPNTNSYCNLSHSGHIT
uniref:Uncharacterized protein n=1 Tax=Esox lucius TaxID=8010 RepID=A0A6Q2ZLV3_ESOLU